MCSHQPEPAKSHRPEALSEASLRPPLPTAWYFKYSETEEQFDTFDTTSAHYRALYTAYGRGVAVYRCCCCCCFRG